MQGIHRDPLVLKFFSCAFGAEETREAMVQAIHRDPLVLNFFSCAFGAEETRKAMVQASRKDFSGLFFFSRLRRLSVQGLIRR